MVSILPIVVVLLILTIRSECAVTFSNCGSGSDAIQLKQLSIVPHPITIPSVAQFTLNVALSQDIVNPIKTEFKLSKKVLLFFVDAPCENGVGSCTYPDWCTFCPTCTCPLFAGTQVLNIPFNVTTTVPTGEYRVEIRFTSKTNQKGCVKIEGIEIKK